MSSQKRFYGLVGIILVLMVASVFFIWYYTNDQINNQYREVLVAKIDIAQGTEITANNVDDFFQVEKVNIHALSEGKTYFTNIPTLSNVVRNNSQMKNTLNKGDVLYTINIEVIDQGGGTSDNITTIDVPIGNVLMTNVAQGSIVVGEKISILGAVSKTGGSVDESIFTVIYSGATIVSVRGDVNTSQSVSLTLEIDENRAIDVLAIVNTDPSRIYYVSGTVGQNSTTLGSVKDYFFGQDRDQTVGDIKMNYKPWGLSTTYTPVKENSLVLIDYTEAQTALKGFDLRWSDFAPYELYVKHTTPTGVSGVYTGYYYLGDESNSFRINYDSRTKEYYIANETTRSHFNADGLYEVTITGKIVSYSNETDETYETYETKTFYFFIKPNTTEVTSRQLSFLNDFDFLISKNDKFEIDLSSRLNFEMSLSWSAGNNSFVNMVNINQISNSYEYKIENILMNGFITYFGFNDVKETNVLAFQSQIDNIIEKISEISRIGNGTGTQTDILAGLLAEDTTGLPNHVTANFRKNLAEMTYYEAEHLLNYLTEVARDQSQLISNNFSMYAEVLYLFMGGKFDTTLEPIFYATLITQLQSSMTFQIGNVKEETLQLFNYDNGLEKYKLNIITDIKLD